MGPGLAGRRDALARERACGRTACRAPSSRTPRSTIPMSPRCWPNTRAARSCAASATSRARRPRPARRGGASPARWTIRAGARLRAAAAARPLLRPADAVVASRRRRRARARLSGDARHPQSHRPAGGPQRRGPRRLAARDGDGGGAPERRGEDLGPRPPRPALDACGERRRSSATTIAIFGVDRCLFASNFPVDSLVATFDAIVSGMKAALADHSLADRRKFFCDNAMRLYRLAEAPATPAVL